MKTLNALALSVVALVGSASAHADTTARFRCYGLEGHAAKTIEIHSQASTELGTHEGRRVSARLGDGVVSVTVIQDSAKGPQGIFFVSPIDRIVYRTMGSKSSAELLNCINLDIE